jgi:hypothetical protein
MTKTTTTRTATTRIVAAIASPLAYQFVANLLEQFRNQRHFRSSVQSARANHQAAECYTV